MGLFNSIKVANQGASDIASGAVHPRKVLKQQLAADTATLQHDPNALGLSDPERQKMIGDATQQANAQQNAAVSQLGQSALAGQGFQQGAFTEAARAIPDQGEKAAAQAAVGVNQLHRQMVDSEKARIMGELDAMRARKAENVKFWTQFGIDTNMAMTSAITEAMGATADTASSMGGMAAMASRREWKKDIVYPNQQGLEHTLEQVLDMRLATWRYLHDLPEDRPHLGIIIDDNPTLLPVTADQTGVDLYTYASMAIAAVQVQQKQIDDLKREIAELKATR